MKTKRLSKAPKKRKILKILSKLLEELG